MCVIKLNQFSASQVNRAARINKRDVQRIIQTFAQRFPPLSALTRFARLKS